MRTYIQVLMAAALAGALVLLAVVIGWRLRGAPEETPAAEAAVEQITDQVHPARAEAWEAAPTAAAVDNKAAVETLSAVYVGPLRSAAAPVMPEEELPEQPEREPVMVYAGRFNVCGYDTCTKCCGWSAGITASGTTATVGRTCASNDFPFGTRLYIEGIGERVVEDRGCMKSGVLDVLCEDHAACYAVTGKYEVFVVEGIEK